MQHDHVIKHWILTFWSHHLSPPRGSGTGLRSKIPFDMFHIYCTSVCSCYHVAAFAIHFYVQHDHVLKKLNFNLLTSRVGGGGGSAFIVFATMLHVAALEIPFNLICNMTMFWKSLILPLTPPPRSTQGSDTGLRSKVRFDMFLIYCTSVCICYHVTAFAIPFDMQHDNVLKKFNFNLLQGPRGSVGEIFATMWLHLWFHLS